MAAPYLTDEQKMRRNNKIVSIARSNDLTNVNYNLIYKEADISYQTNF